MEEENETTENVSVWSKPTTDMTVGETLKMELMIAAVAAAVPAVLGVVAGVVGVAVKRRKAQKFQKELEALKTTIADDENVD